MGRKYKSIKMEPYFGMTCPHCGEQTNIDPALVMPDDPMLYCPECDEPLFSNSNEDA